MIERIVIFHTGLLPEGGLAEGASIKEINEHILYFIDYRYDPLSNIPGFETDGSDGITLDAVMFAGLCRALHSLSSTMQCYDDNFLKRNNKKVAQPNVVHMSSYTILFIPLEECETDGIMAAIQIQTLDENTKIKYKYSISEISYAIKKVHDMFQLSKGGIHYRLSLGRFNQEDVLQEENTASSVYPGMQELYNYHNKLRNELQARNNNESEMTFNQMVESLHIFRKTIPLGLLKSDLKGHYDNFPFYDMHFCTRNYPAHYHVSRPSSKKENHLIGLFHGVGISLLGTFLPPFRHDKRKSHYNEFRTANISSKLVKEIGLLISPPGPNDKRKVLIGDHILLSRDFSKLCLGMSLFSCGKHITTEIRSSHVSLSSEIVCSLLELLFTTVGKHSVLEDERDIDSSSILMGSYLSPPALATLCKSEGAQKVVVSGKDVWIPSIFVPCKELSHKTEINVALYGCSHIDLVIYLWPQFYASKDFSSKYNTVAKDQTSSIGSSDNGSTTKDHTAKTPLAEYLYSIAQYLDDCLRNVLNDHQHIRY